MSGDNLAVALFLWSLCAIFFFEGRKDEGWRQWLLWGFSALCLVGGFAWPYMGKLWPAGFAFVRTLAVSPVSWFVVFMSAIMLVAVSAVVANAVFNKRIVLKGNQRFSSPQPLRPDICRNRLSTSLI